MPRKNRNVRQRNIPRAAQTRHHDTHSAQFDARQQRESRHIPLGSLDEDPENGLYSGYPAKLDKD